MDEPLTAHRTVGETGLGGEGGVEDATRPNASEIWRD